MAHEKENTMRDDAFARLKAWATNGKSLIEITSPVLSAEGLTKAEVINERPLGTWRVEISTYSWRKGGYCSNVGTAEAPTLEDAIHLALDRAETAPDR